MQTENGKYADGVGNHMIGGMESNRMQLCDVKRHLQKRVFWKLLTSSVYNPTKKRIQRRIAGYERDPHVLALAYMEEKVPVGILILREEGESTYEILDFAVLPFRRREGLGRQMLNACRRQLPMRMILAETDDDAVGFYRKYGFSIQELGDVYHSGITRYLCRLCL